MNIELLSSLLAGDLAPTSPVLAYIGPGGGLSALGALIALVAAAALAFFGFVWYPIKRLRRKIRSHAKAPRPEPMPERTASARK